MKQLFTLFVVIMIFSFSNAQIKNGSYDYVIIPRKFDFLNDNDQYKLNTLLRFLFKKENNDVYFDSEQLPSDRCNSIFADVKKEKGGLFKTKLKIVITDCFNAVLFESQIGDSKEKDYKKAYHEALREAFESVKFAQITNTRKLTITSRNSTSTAQNKTKIEQPKTVELKPTVKKTASTSVKNVKQDTKEATSNADALYAQRIGNGYQLVDRVPKVIMILLDTAFENVFMVKNQNAIIFKEDNKWYFYENTGDKTSKIEVNIKF